MAKTLLRLAIILLAAAPIIAASFWLKQFTQGDRNLTAIMQSTVKRPATPHAQELVFQTLNAMQQGHPNYGSMRPETAQEIRHMAPTLQPRLARLGPLKSVTYVGGSGRADIYRAQFANTFILCPIVLDKNGLIQGVGFLTGDPPSPQASIDNYGNLPWDDRSLRMAKQTGILLAIALFGRLALRLRL